MSSKPPRPIPAPTTYPQYTLITDLPIRGSRPMPVEYPSHEASALTCPNSSLEDAAFNSNLQAAVPQHSKNSTKVSMGHYHHAQNFKTTSSGESKPPDEVTRTLRDFLLGLPGASMSGLGYQ